MVLSEESKWEDVLYALKKELLLMHENVIRRVLCLGKKRALKIVVDSC